jgi:hypothetical protein
VNWWVDVASASKQDGTFAPSSRTKIAGTSLASHGPCPACGEG